MYLYSQRISDMITLISATNRPGSYTRRVATFYSKRLELAGVEHTFLSLEDMPQDLLTNAMYDSKRLESMNQLQEKFLIPAEKFIFIIPEYNGSYPGVLKAFIDASDIKKCWQHKKAALLGVADGRAGNLRGMDDFTNVLNYLKINVLHLKIPISSIGNNMDENHQLTSTETIGLIDQQIQLFKAF